jgi:TerC family integral membrane protein
MLHPWTWAGFVLLIGAMIAVDLGASHRRHTSMSMRRALVWSAIWVAVSVAFGFFIWMTRGGAAAAQFFTGYVLEKSLSVDNLFVFLLVFAQFRVPSGEQHRVLTWGILGAVLLRGAMILGGIKLLHAFHPLAYVLGALLLWTGIRTFLQRPDRLDQPALSERRLTRFLRRVVPFVPRYDGGRFFTHESGRRVGTMLLFVLVVVECLDALFAIDSIPAIFAVTDDPFLVFSSNILAVLGLRALFFVVADLLRRLRYLHYGLGLILALMGAKLCLADVVRIDPIWSLAGTVAVLGSTIAASLVAPRRPLPSPETP